MTAITVFLLVTGCSVLCWWLCISYWKDLKVERWVILCCAIVLSALSVVAFSRLDM